MSLVDQIAALPGRPPSPREPVNLAKAADAVRTRYPGFGSVKHEALEVLVMRATAAFASGAWGDLTEGDIATLVRSMAAGEMTLPSQLELFLLTELRVSTRRNLLGALCEGFLVGWTPRHNKTANLAQIIIARSSWLPRNWQVRFAVVPDPLDTNSGAETFGRWLATQSDPYSAALGRGIAAPHGPGFMHHVHDAWLALQPLPNDESKARQLVAWIVPAGAPALRGPKGAQVVAQLLFPWRSTMPPAGLRKFLLATIVETYGDPRRDNAEFWYDVGADGHRVMLRWLAGRRMEVFLEVVSRAEAMNAKGEQWDSRRRFWTAVYESGRIDEAWVSFGKDAVRIAGQLNRATGDIAYTEFGRTDKPRKDTCLLIMRIGSKIIVEGSHDFRVHVFDAAGPNTPALYADLYDVDQFILPQGHHNARRHDAPGQWMNWVRKRIL